MGTGCIAHGDIRIDARIFPVRTAIEIRSAQLAQLRIGSVPTSGLGYPPLIVMVDCTRRPPGGMRLCDEPASDYDALRWGFIHRGPGARQPREGDTIFRYFPAGKSTEKSIESLSR